MFTVIFIVWQVIPIIIIDKPLESSTMQEGTLKIEPAVAYHIGSLPVIKSKI